MRRRQRRERRASESAPRAVEKKTEEKKPGDLGATRGGRILRRLLVGVAVLVSLAVAGIGGWRSFTAVSAYFHSWTVPVIADGVIVAASALRLAALTYRWRMPGSMMVTVTGLAGTVYLNVHASQGNGADEFSHALAPIAYLILLEMLGYFLKLRLQLEVQEEARLSMLVWLVSPVVTTRAWLLMVRTGQKNPALARAAIQRSIRARSQLQIICPASWYAPLGAARGARSAALQTIRDGLLTAAQVVELLPEGQARMGAVELLVAVNRAALAIDDDTTPAVAEPVDEQGAQLDESQTDADDAAQQDIDLDETKRSEQHVDEIPELVERMERALAVREVRPRFHEMAIELGCSSEVFWAAVEAMGGWEETWDRLHPPKQEQQDEEQDSGHGRRRRSDGGGGDNANKKDQFLAAAVGDLQIGDRRIIDQDSKVRNPRAIELGATVNLHPATAQRYGRELQPELANQDVQQRPEIAALPAQRSVVEYSNGTEAPWETEAHSA